MMNKLSLFFFFLFFSISNAETALIRVELGNERLEPLYARDLKIIKELNHSALIIIDDAEFSKLAGLNYKMLQKSFKEGNYYLVYQFHKIFDLHSFGEILTVDDNITLIKIDEQGLLRLNREPVEIVRLSFKPLVKTPMPVLPTVRQHPIIEEIVNKVNPDTVLSFVRRLQQFRTRYSTHDSCHAAANWIRNKFIEYGCDSVYFQYHTSGHAPNVIGIKWGAVYPDTYAIIDGHFDATSNQAPNIAPGADDNASGTAAVLEAARV
ncbi:MAG: M28 family peptidase, partial [bacterium]